MQKLLLPAKAVNIFPRTYGADALIPDQQYRVNRKKGDIPQKTKCSQFPGCQKIGTQILQKMRKKGFKSMKTNKKLLALLLSVVMMFSLSVTAFASWNQFQKDSSHSGKVTGGLLPTSTPSTSTSFALRCADSWVDNAGLPGVDATPVIVGDTAYVLYNSGANSDNNGGVRVASIALGSSPSETWSVKLGSDLNTDNIQQLATPYFEGNSSTLFAPVTYNKDIIAGKTITVSEGASISADGILSLPGNTETEVTISSVVVEAPTKSLYFATGITMAAGKSISGSVTFTKADGTSQSFGTSTGYEGYEFCLYNNTGVEIEAGTYTVTIMLSPGSACEGTTKLRSVTPYWMLYKLNTSAQTVTPSVVLDANGNDVGGPGQANTPITGTTYNGHEYIYFGIYDGTSVYYQYDYNTSTLTSFTPGETNDGFYWAGAAVVGSNVVFGAENGYVYSRPIGSTFGSASGSKVNLRNIQPNAGKVRSSICYDATGGYLYLTTSNAYLWRLSSADITSASCVCFADEGSQTSGDVYVLNSSSTPVVSGSGRVYVGGYNIYWKADGTSVYRGALKNVKASEWNSSETPVYTNWQSADSGAIQSSPVVSYVSLRQMDYVYFTTNGPDGKIVCQRAARLGTGSAEMWSAESGTYTLQGIAVSDDGYIVFGNDNNRLFVCKK